MIKSKKIELKGENRLCSSFEETKSRINAIAKLTKNNILSSDIV